MKQNTATIVTSVLIGLLVGILAMGAYFSYRSDSDKNDDTNTANGTSSVSVLKDNGSPRDVIGATPTPSTNIQNSNGSPAQTNGELTLIVQDQQAGNSVRIESVQASQTLWVVVSEDVQGRPGRILGARLYEPGIGVNEVILLRNTVSGNTYHATFYSDINADRKFDHRVDAPVATPAGSPLSVVFRVQ